MRWLWRLVTGQAAAARRREQVEQDGLFYCRGCGTKGVKKPSNDTAPVCSQSCRERLNAVSLCQTMGGGIVVMVDAGPEEHAAANALRSRKWKTYCAWCGATITSSQADACPKCHGNPRGSHTSAPSDSATSQAPSKPAKRK